VNLSQKQVTIHISHATTDIHKQAVSYKSPLLFQALLQMNMSLEHSLVNPGADAMIANLCHPFGLSLEENSWIDFFVSHFHCPPMPHIGKEIGPFWLGSGHFPHLSHSNMPIVIPNILKPPDSMLALVKREMKGK
jgi:hypothetical protein